MGKVKILKKIIKDPTLCDLLKPLGRSRDLLVEDADKVQEFTRKVIYSGKTDEAYVDTRVRLYRSMKVKSSMSLPPDPDSILQVIKRAHHRTYYWLRCLEKEIYQLEIEDYGWKWCEKLKLMRPVWFTGAQLPPSFKSRRGKKMPRENSESNDIADIELSDTQEKLKPKKKNRKRAQAAKNVEDETNMDLDDESVMEEEAPYLGDDEFCEENETEESNSAVISSDESSWEMSDFASSEESEDEWLP